jgi:hypothetical protein
MNGELRLEELDRRGDIRLVDATRSAQRENVVRSGKGLDHGADLSKRFEIQPPLQVGATVRKRETMGRSDRPAAGMPKLPRPLRLGDLISRTGASRRRLIGRHVSGL